MTECSLWAPRAWIGGAWQDGVLFSVRKDGCFGSVRPGVDKAAAGVTVLPGPVLPGMVNAHSHAFQRAFAGMAERRSNEHDDFWSWRDRMYGVALRIGPDQLQAIATQLYREMLAGGYTHVCEFHYLHHAPDGARYDDPLTMSWALMAAAQSAGIGITLLPVLYERAGFAQPELRADQRRFATSTDEVLALHDAMLRMVPHIELEDPARSRSDHWLHERRWSGLMKVGAAVHSLRAARPESIVALKDGMITRGGPIHIHVAEQTTEVDECLAHTGLRPIQWLTHELGIDERWQLVHATHATEQEIRRVAWDRAGVVICPSTEANLGDGFTDVAAWLQSNTALSIGSDSHVSRSLTEELRWLEYGQRLLHRRRNVSALPTVAEGSTAARLFDRMLAGGARAAGFLGDKAWGLQAGARADLLVLDGDAPGLAGVPDSHLLDAAVFATGAPPLKEVWAGGRRRWFGGDERDQKAANGFKKALGELWR